MDDQDGSISELRRLENFSSERAVGTLALTLGVSISSLCLGILIHRETLHTYAAAFLGGYLVFMALLATHSFRNWCLARRNLKQYLARHPDLETFHTI